MLKRLIITAGLIMTCAQAAFAVPVVAITAPVNNAKYTPPAAITLTATATDNAGTISKVAFFNGSTLIGTVAAAPYTFAWNNVATGKYTVTAKATNNSNITTTSAAISVTVNTPPTATLTAPIASASYAGIATVNLAANATDTDGTITKVDFYRSSTLIGTSTAAPYAFTWTNVQPGSYSITARATDNLGGVTTSSAAAITVTNPITVAISAPLNNAKYTPPAAINISANASDTNGTISKVEFFNGATLIGTDTAAPYTFAWTNVGIGKYTITAKATDSQGLTKTSTAIAVTVNTPPTVTLTAPIASASYVGVATVNLAANATDTDGTITKVDFYRSSTLIGTSTAAPYAFTWTNVQPGSYSITARATDNLGGVTNSSAAAITVTNPITVAISAPLNNAKYTPPAAINLSANASDTNGTISKVEFFSGATLIGTATAAPYTVAWTNVATGKYTITARATDSQNLTKTSSAITVVVDTPPVVSLIAPTANASYIAPAMITLTANSSDSDGTISKVQFYNGATLIGTVTAAPYTFSWNNVATGNYSLTARATDNLDVVTISTAVPISVIANVAPTATLITPANNARYAAPATVSLSSRATAGSGSSIAKVDYYNGANFIGMSTTAPYNVSWSGVLAGSYPITAKATDNVGRTGTSAIANITVVNNIAPTITFSATPQNATAPATITLSATAADSDGSIAKVEFFNGATLIATDTTAPYSFSWNSVPVGSYSVTAKATDNLGTSTTSTPITINVTGQVAQIYYVDNDHLNTPRTITDGNGNKVWEWKNEDAFGSNVPNDNPAGLGTFTFNQRMPGQYADKETGLFYNWNRFYNPATGRYEQSDLIGLGGGINTYAYVEGNPLSFIDPEGLAAAGASIGGAIGSAIGGRAGPIGAKAGRAIGAAAGSAIEDMCTPDKPCPPCRTISGKIVPVGTVGYRPLDVIPDDVMQHGVYGSHHNLFVAKQYPAPKCDCFWSKQKNVAKPNELQSGWIPVEPFVN